MAPAIAKRDGPLSRSRYYGGTGTLSEVASASDASFGPPALDQLIPVATLHSAQGSHTRGPVLDRRGILVQSL